MQKMHQRDFFSYSEKLSLVQFYSNPIREFLKLGKLFLKTIYTKILRFYFPKKHLEKLKKENKLARPRSSEFFISNKDYFEISIGNQTRTVCFFDNYFSFEQQISVDDEFLFGLTPTINESEINKINKWCFELTISSTTNSNLIKKYSAEFPYNGRSECFAYFPDSGWIDFNVSLDIFYNDRCKFELKAKCKDFKNNTLPRLEFSLSNPQIIKKNNSTQKNILLISGESLTDLGYLKENYPECEFPNFEKLFDDSVNFPKTYSPADNTLSFGASILSGLMPSQHGIGDYSKMPWNYDNQIVNNQIINLPKVLKSEGFFNIFGGTESRFSSKLGWARDFDHYFHVFEKWSETIPKVDWIQRAFQNYNGFNKFIMVHLDYLHEPLVAFHDLEKPRMFDLSLIDKTKNDNTRQLYFEQLKLLDDQLGVFISSLKEKNEYENTAIILTGDHGAGINWVKQNTYSLYEERIRVPLTVKYPSWSKNNLFPSKISNSCFEIYKIISAMLGKALPDYFENLPQYDKKYNDYAFTETIMNPNKEFKSHKIAVINDKYKYVAWNKIDWNFSKIEESFFDEKLFGWDENKNTFNENENMLKDKMSLAKKYQELTKEIINQNLTFHKQYKPESF